MPSTEIAAFLQAPRHAVIGVNRPDGPPHLSPVWYLYEDSLFTISITTATVKYRLLRRDPRVSLCIDGGYPDYRTVMNHPGSSGIRRVQLCHPHRQPRNDVKRSVIPTNTQFLAAVRTTEEVARQNPKDPPSACLFA
jgi:hypothetical protein